MSYEKLSSSHGGTSTAIAVASSFTASGASLTTSRGHHHRRRQNQQGFTILETMIAVALLSLVVVIYAGANAVQRNIQTNTVHRSNSHNAAIYKTQELLKPANLDQLIKKIPAGQTAIGSLWPKPMLSGFSDELDLRGKVVAPGKGEFVRQWAAVKDFPNPGQTTVYVSIKDRHSTDPARVYSKVRGEAKDQVK